MLTAKFGDDELLVSISSQIEKAAPWTDKKPPVYSS
jgi:Asp-tRNA(Asn)/Glu-tRNA(Gln) amidotransferase A subunit family amidase